jgi:hypothetical protein
MAEDVITYLRALADAGYDLGLGYDDEPKP